MSVPPWPTCSGSPNSNPYRFLPASRHTVVVDTSGSEEEPSAVRRVDPDPTMVSVEISVDNFSKIGQNNNENNLKL